MRLIVTGSAGLIGKRLVAAFRNHDHTLVEIDLRSPAVAARDFRSPEALQLIDQSIDGIVHLAAVSRVAWGEADPQLCHAINVEGTARLLERLMDAAPRAWFLFASSREVYGEAGRRPVVESDPLLPVNTYGRSKRDSEELVRAARGSGLATATLRLCNVYGGREDHPDRAVPSLAQDAIEGRTLRLTGGDAFFDFVHVDDVVAGFLRASELLAAGERELPTLHLATGRATTLRTLAQMAIAAARSSSRIDEQEARSFDVSGFCGAPDAAEHALGWRARIPLETGLAGVVADLRANGPLVPFPLSRLQS